MQQINLYVSELRPRKDWFSSKYLTVVFIGFLTVLLLGNFIKSREVSALEDELNEKQLVLRALEIELEKSKLQPQQSSRAEIQKNIQLLQRKIGARERLSALIKGQAIDDNFSFHSAMISMAKNATSKVSIERFTFSKGGKYIEMNGEGARSYDVPIYLNNLRKDKVFGSSRFGLISIGNIKKSGNVDFSVGQDGSPSFGLRGEK